MKDKPLNFFKKSAIFTGMTFFQKGVAFFLVPLYTQFLSPEQYGIANLVNSIAAIYILAVTFSLDDAIARFYFEYRNNSEKIKEVVTTITLVSLSISLIFFTGIIVGNRIFIKPFTGNISFYPYALLALIPVLCSPVYGLVQKILMIEGKAIHYSLNSFLFFIINTALCILLIAIFKFGALGVLLSSAISYGIYFIYSLFFLVPKMSFKINKQVFFDSMKYGLTLLPNRVASWGLGGINKVIVGNYISVYALGIFNVALIFSSMIIVFANSLSLSIQPWIFHKLEQNHEKRDIFNFVNIIAALFCIVGFSISLFSNEIISLLVENRYVDAAKVLPTLLLGTTAGAYSILFVHILYYYTNYTKYIAFSTIVGAVLNILLCLILIPNLESLGACIALAVSQIIVCLIQIKYAIKASGQNYPRVSIFLFLIVSYIISQMSIQLNVTFIGKAVIYIIFTLSYLLYIKNNLLYFKDKLVINRSKKIEGASNE